MLEHIPHQILRMKRELHVHCRVRRAICVAETPVAPPVRAQEIHEKVSAGSADAVDGCQTQQRTQRGNVVTDGCADPHALMSGGRCVLCQDEEGI